MPGILGIVDLERKSNLETIIGQMAEAIKHQDWHTIHTCADHAQGIALGRVSTGILNPEPQPIFNEDRSLAIVMEGEVFDYQALKGDLISKGHNFAVNNDPEFALHLYKELGNDFVTRLNGFFVIAIWDKLKQKLIIANDRYGYRPLYYAQVNSELIFCSEIKGILADRAFRRRVDDAAVADFFAYGHLLEDRTLFQGIRLLPPASLLILQNKDLSRKQYWRPDQGMQIWPGSEEQYLEQLDLRFRQAVQRQLRGSHGIAVSLSGGLDSRAVLAVVDHHTHKVHSFLHGVKGCLDEEIAGQVAARTTGERHHFFELGTDFLNAFERYAQQTVYLTDGMSKLGLTQVLYTRQKVRDFAQIELNSSGADYTRGWGLNDEIVAARNHEEAVLACYRRYKSMVDEAQLFAPSYYKNIEGQASEAMKRVLANLKEGLSSAQKGSYFYLYEHARKLFLNSWTLAGNFIEYRAPYYDNDLVDLLLQAPQSLLNFRRRIPKFIIAQNNPELAKIPMAINYMASPFYENPAFGPRYRYLKDLVESYSRRFFAPFMPRLARLLTFSRPYVRYDDWMRKELRPFIEGILLDSRTLDRGYYNRIYLREMISRHMSRRANLSNELGIMVAFELWHRLFIDG